MIMIDEVIRDRMTDLSEKIVSLQTKTNQLEVEVKELREALLVALTEVKKLKGKARK